ncbi:MAG TPA: hypothetical protein VJ697_13140 [Nitrososphaeraceae archaeon]|nr:hypothetical protein [Nitrososphaeraceae archaeon]
MLLQEAEAGWLSDLKKNVKKMEKTNDDIEDMQECAEKNLEKTQFYSKQNKIYIANPDCDPDNQYKYDKLNMNNEINEYEDKANFIIGTDFDEDEEEKDDDDKDKKKKKNKDDD